MVVQATLDPRYDRKISVSTGAEVGKEQPARRSTKETVSGAKKCGSIPPNGNVHREDYDSPEDLEGTLFSGKLMFFFF